MSTRRSSVLPGVAQTVYAFIATHINARVVFRHSAAFSLGIRYAIGDRVVFGVRLGSYPCLRVHHASTIDQEHPPASA